VILKVWKEKLAMNYPPGKNLRSLHVRPNVHLEQLENLVFLEHLEQLDPLEKEEHPEDLVHPENQGKLVSLECPVILEDPESKDLQDLEAHLDQRD
jgi:hypothetical protein